VGIVAAIVAKDLREFSRDRLWILLTPLTMVMIVLVFWLLPDRVDESIRVGLYPPSYATTMRLMGAGQGDEHGLDIVPFDSPESLARAVSGEIEDEEREVAVGVAFPDRFVSSVRQGEPTTVTVYVDRGVPPTVRRAISSGIRELSYALRAGLSGQSPAEALPVALPDEQTILLGEDRAGRQVPLRDKMRPFLAMVLLIMEALALAGLVAVELQKRTVTALLVTPARPADVLVAKGITGALLGLGQVLVFLIATKSLSVQPLVVLAAVVLGAAMMSAVGMLAGSTGKDFMSTLFTGILFLIPVIIPAIATLVPGASSWWVELLPSYGIIESLVGAIGYGRGFAELGTSLAMAAGWVVILFVIGVVVLRWRVATL
jgi:ABC-2 type transport system permease protein